MELTTQEIEQIEKYYQEKLPPDERAVFEKRMQEESEFASEVNTYLQIFKGFKGLEIEQFEQKVKNWEDTIRKKELRRKKGAYLIFAIAAGILLLVVATFWWANSRYSDQALAEDYYRTPVYEGLRDSSGTSDELLAGLQAYFEKDFEKAILQLEAIPKSNSHYLEALYYLGHCHFQLGAYNKSINAFEQVLANITNEKYSTQQVEFEKASWMRILSLLGSEAPIEKVQQELQQLINEKGHPFSENAKVLQDDLQVFWRKFL